MSLTAATICQLQSITAAVRTKKFHWFPTILSIYSESAY